MKKYNNEELAENIINMLKEKLDKDYPKGDTKRDAHPKCLGLLKAYFVVDEQLPKEYQVGIFQQGKVYPSFIRISNSNPKIKSDKSKDFRGFSIKLLGVDGKRCLYDEKNTQDFLLISNETMPLGTLKLFHDAIYYTSKSNPAIFGIKLLLQNKLPSIISAIKNRKHDTSPLDIKYFSTTPYLFGNKAVKYSIVPKSTYKSELPKTLTQSYLTKNMKKHLNKQEAIFDFMVQFQTNNKEMPINNSAIKWKEEKSPFIKLAEIRIPLQEFTTKKRFDLAEIMSFSPGNSLLIHRPIGDLNEGRMKIYKEMSKFRHSRNDEVLFEASEEDFYNIR